jgi:hypothetical protein
MIGLKTHLLIFLLALPFLLLPSTALVFSWLAKRLGKEKGYLLGFCFYWMFWCLLIPLMILGLEDFLSIFVQQIPLFSRSNGLAAVVFAVIILVTVIMYGKGFLQAPKALILIAIPPAVINGFCEEVLWRGLYVRAFPEDFWLAILYPASGFALWHLAPWQVFSEGSKFAFIFSTFFLGLANGFIAYQTGSALWPAISHSLGGILALGGAVAPSMLALFPRPDS